MGQEKDLIEATLSAAAFSGFTGGIFGGLQAAWADAPVAKTQSVAQQIAKTGRTVSRPAGIFALVGGTYVFGMGVSRNLMGEVSFAAYSLVSRGERRKIVGPPGRVLC